MTKPLPKVTEKIANWIKTDKRIYSREGRDRLAQIYRCPKPYVARLMREVLCADPDFVNKDILDQELADKYELARQSIAVYRHKAGLRKPRKTTPIGQGKDALALKKWRAQHAELNNLMRTWR